MQSLRRLISYAGWPAAAGILFAAAVLLAALFMQRSGLFQNPQPANRGWQGPVSYADAVSRAAPSVVNIYTSRAERRSPLLNDPFFRDLLNRSNVRIQQRIRRTLGSGVIINESGYLLTNKHVINQADAILVRLADGRETTAEIVGSDSNSDLAVLKIELDNLQPIPLGEPNKTRVGDVVLAIGNPFGFEQTVTQGIISATGRYGQIDSASQNFLQTDAAVNPGNSGGALVDAYGNLIGINTAIFGDTAEESNNSPVGIGFAIPADVAVQVLRDILEYGQVLRGWLGVRAQSLTELDARQLRLSFKDGIKVTGVYANGPASRAGLQVDDVITKVNNQIITDRGPLELQISQTRPGDTVELEVWRNGRPQIIEVTVGIAPTTTG